MTWRLDSQVYFAVVSEPPVITLAIDDWLFERLMTFEAGTEDLKDNGDGEPDDGAEVDGG